MPNLRIISDKQSSHIKFMIYCNKMCNYARKTSKIRKLVKKEKVDVVYLNTAFDVYALVRDFISLFFIRQANVKIMLKSHGSNADFLKTKNTIYRFMIKN